MNARKKLQAARTGSRGRKRVMKSMRGGRTVVVSPEVKALMNLVHPMIPARIVLEMQKRAATAKRVDGEVPVIDLNAPYKPGRSTVERLEQEQSR
jgi:hypothetical protein